ncbi:hypothetical protein BBJ28_00003592 [Nothophytophthora sp. Chile5]|nr:hypothetical protein BBJ28_00003592 [Nothophytophthora sp. Chile5]
MAATASRNGSTRRSAPRSSRIKTMVCSITPVLPVLRLFLLLRLHSDRCDAVCSFVTGLADARGPGALFSEDWNSLAANALQHKPSALYRTDRDVNPTLETTVQRFYDPQNASNMGVQIKRKGNAVVALQSSVPRFRGRIEESETPRRGPGAYFHERYHGAFPTLLEKMTPHNVRVQKQQAKCAFAATFAISPVPTDLAASSSIAVPSRPTFTSKLRLDGAKKAPPNHGPELADTLCQTARLAPTLTPRNAYQNAANRQLLLARCQSADVSSALDSLSPS